MRFRKSQVAIRSALCAFGICATSSVSIAQKAPRAAPSADTTTRPGLEQRLGNIVGRPGGLTADEVARRTVPSSPGVRAKQAQVAAAAAEVDRALVAYYPRLTLIGKYTRNSPYTNPSLGDSAPPGSPLAGIDFRFPSILNQYWLQANLTIPLSDYFLRIRQGHRAASHSQRAAELNVQAAARQASLQAKLAYYNFVSARLGVEVASQSVEQAKAHLETARAIFEGGRTPRADMLRAESRLAGAELLLERSNNLARLAEEQIRLLTRDTSAKRYEIGEDLAEVPPAAEESASVAALQNEALSKRVEFQALSERERALGEQRRAAQAGNYPQLSAFGNAYYANPNPRYQPPIEEWRATWDVGVQLTWSPNDLGTSSAGVSSVDAARAEIEAQRAALRDQVRTDVLNAYQMVKEARVALATTEHALTAAEEAYRVRKELYDLGRSNLVEVIDAETDLLNARLELIKARINLRVGKAQLLYALGRESGM